MFETPEWKAFALKEKLKLLKLFLRNWNKEHFGELDSVINSISKEINNLDSKADVFDLSEGGIDSRKKLFEELWRKSRTRESLLLQKSKAMWIKEGDANSSFFHACINARRRKN